MALDRTCDFGAALACLALGRKGRRGMTTHRRGILTLVIGAAASPILPTIGFGLDYPTRPVRILVGFAPGGVPDIVARLVGQWLSERLGQPFVVENHAGAASNLALEDAAKAAPDGYTLYLVSVANAINVSLYQGANVEHDIAPIAGVASAAFVIVVTPSSATPTIPALIASAKSHPGKINVGCTAIGTPPYMAVSLFKKMANIDFVQVPFRNSLQAVQELLAGRIDFAISDMSVIEYVKAGKLRALAVTTATRQRAIPDVPSFSEFLPGYDASTWYGLGAAKDTPPQIINVLSTAVASALKDPKHAAHLEKLGLTVNVRSPGEFGTFISDETKKWAEVIKAANIKPQ
jgi:tripartite-type tricarboxylate transporter receptor subunit TctC